MIRDWWSEVRRYKGSPEDMGKGPMMEWTLVIGLGRMQAPGSGNSLDGWGYLCGGSLEEEMGEQIAKVEWWCLQGASHAHPEGGPDAEISIPVKQGQARPAACFPVPTPVPKPFQVLRPRSLDVCLRSSHLPFSQGQLPSQPSPPLHPHRCQLTCSPSSSSWGLSASMPWRGKTNGGGELGFGGGRE